MMKDKLPKAVSILILTGITLVMWVIFVIYQSLVQAPVTKVDPNVISPLDPKIDSAIIDQMENRVFIQQ